MRMRRSFRPEVEKLVVMDAFLPGVGDWPAVYDGPVYWHFRFHGPSPSNWYVTGASEDLLQAYFWNGLSGR